MALNINQLLAPLGEVTTPIGTLYLYSWKASKLNQYSEINSEALTNRIRNFFQEVSSFDQRSNFREGEPQPLTEQEASELSETDLERLAEKYVKFFLNGRFFRELSHRIPIPQPPVWARGESATAFLDRLLKHQIQLDKAGMLEQSAQFTKLSARIRLENFRKYTEELEIKFNADKDSLLAQKEMMLSEHEAELQEHVNRNFREAYYIVDEIYLGQYRKSTLVSIYSFLEFTMMNLCDLVQLFYNSSLGVKDLRGKGINQAKLYLEKVAKINFEELNAEWSELVTLNKVRNHIVHADGVEDIVSKDLTKLANRTQGLSIKKYGRLLVERTYIDSSITTVENFLDELYSKVL